MVKLLVKLNLEALLAFFAFLLYLSPTGISQDTPLESLKVASNVTFRYNGNIIYPRLSEGIEFPVSKVDVTDYQRGRHPVHHFS